MNISETTICWPEKAYAVPNSFLRSALFGAVKRGRKPILDKETIASVDGLEIMYSGKRLNQADLDIYLTIIYLLRDKKLGEKHKLSAGEILRTLGRTVNGKNAKLLEECIERLQFNSVRIQFKNFLYLGSLIHEAYKDEQTREWVIVLNEKLKSLFIDHQYTLIGLKIRKELAGKPLAQWLHGFYESHKKPYPMKIETLMKLAGSENVNMRSAKAALFRALTEVNCVMSKYKMKFDFVEKDNKIYVEK